MNVSSIFRCVFILSLALCATAQVGKTKEISPAEDYCREINDPSSGSEVVLKPGVYRGACKVRRSGKPGIPLVIRGLNLTGRSRIEYEGKNGNLLEIYADNIVIHGLEFGPTSSDVDGIRIFSGDYLTIEDCAFDQIGGIAVVANHASIKGLIVRRNSIDRSASTAMYFGCHDGVACTVSQLLIERNFINGVTARESEIGYGIQVKLNSVGTVRDNVIINTKGPGVMIYGSNDLNAISIVERNFVARSRESAGVVIGGGPVIVRNNIILGNKEGGIGLENYGRRGLLRKIVVTHNTVYKNGRGGILMPSEGSAEAEISRNAVGGSEGTPPFPSERKGLLMVGNQDCGNTGCFADPENRDFTPLKGSSLFEIGKDVGIGPSATDDYFGRVRGIYPVVGAIEGAGGAIELGIKP
jgi:hypothetical protein